MFADSLYPERVKEAEKEVGLELPDSIDMVKGVPTPPPLRPSIDWSRVEQESLRVEQEEEDIRLGRR